MYIPPYFKVTDPEIIRSFIQENNFGILVSHVNQRLWATHIPFLMSQGKLIAHMSRGNKQWREAEGEVMAIFQGPHDYISSSWYGHENVPTWNYLTAHVYGTFQVLSEDDLHKHLGELMNHHEAGFDKPLKISDLSEPFVKRELRGAQGFEINITEIQMAFKLSQNRNEEDYLEVIKQLNASNRASSKELAKCMEQEFERMNKEQ